MSTLETTLTLIGGPTVLIELAGFRLLTDPTFDEPGAYHSGTVTLEKTRSPASVPRRSAASTRRCSATTSISTISTGPAGPSCRRYAATFTTLIGAGRLGGAARGPRPGRRRCSKAGTAAGCVTATPARHGPVGNEPIAGDVAGFLLGVDAPGDAAYVSGDTVWYEGVAEVASAL